MAENIQASKLSGDYIGVSLTVNTAKRLFKTFEGKGKKNFYKGF